MIKYCHITCKTKNKFNYQILKLAASSIKWNQFNNKHIILMDAWLKTWLPFIIKKLYALLQLLNLRSSNVLLFLVNTWRRYWFREDTFSEVYYHLLHWYYSLWFLACFYLKLGVWAFEMKNRVLFCKPLTNWLYLKLFLRGSNLFPKEWKLIFPIITLIYNNFSWD